ncbi:zinc-binding dehydrogenase [Echinicola sediminis]
MKSEATAMVFNEAKVPFTASSIALPELKEGEVLVKNIYSTICASDLHTFYGRRNACRHSILGHEIIGEVVGIAKEGVEDYFGDALSLGDKITWSVYAHDPHSRTSQKGYPQKCETLYKYGHEQIGEHYQLNGGFASHCHLRKGTSIFKLPSGLSNQEAAPLNCTHATIAGAIRLAGSLQGKNVLINGVGMLGLSACAMSKEQGATRVWAMDIDPKKLAKAKAFGADQSILYHSEQTLPWDSIRELGGIDVIIETSGVPDAVENCVKLLGIGGTVVLVGSVFAQRDVQLNAEHIVRNLLTIKGLHNYKPEDLASAIAFLEAKKEQYPFEGLVGKEFPLHELDEAFETGNKGKFYRVGVRP